MRGLERYDASSLLTRWHKQLHAFASLVTKHRQNRTRHLDEWEPRRSELPEPDQVVPELETAFVIAPQHAVCLERCGEPVRCCAGKARRLLQFRQHLGFHRDRTQHHHRLVEHTNTRYAVHIERTVSHNVG